MQLSLSAHRWVGLLLACLVLLSGCATTPPPQDTRDFRARAERRQDGGVRVAASVLGSRESEAEFGAPLASKGIQPVWLEIRNSESQEFVLMLLSIDPDYFSPSEVAWQAGAGREPLEALRRFDEAHISIVIPPRSE